MKSERSRVWGRGGLVGGRPGVGEAAAVLAGVAGIGVAHHIGWWPDSLQGTAGIVVQAFVVVLPALPRGVRWAFDELRRREGGPRARRPKGRGHGRSMRPAGGSATPGLSEEGPGPTTEGEGAIDQAPVVTPSEEVGASGIGEGKIANGDVLAAFLPVPTMWPTRLSVSDNDDVAKPTAM